ncbi:MAG: hypothetical protein HY964_02200 [Ignavibacteriales bacterium]|nr:hypothetical protein [Ignavibacteriales bacterium]
MHNPFLKSTWFVVVIVALTILNISGCTDVQDINGNTTSTQVTSFTKLSIDDPAVQEVMAVQNKNTSDLMSDKNIIGTATGMTADGRLAILVYLKEGSTSPKGLRTLSSIPKELEGIPVVVEVTGEIKAMAVLDHQVKQTPPIQLGTSGGWRYDLANGYCCGGTLGSMIQKSGVQYVLSNYHVLMADIVAGGNSRIATAGDPVIQPGLIDVGCVATSAQDVATLVGNWSLPSSNVDAAIAQVIPGMVMTNGAILEVGTISATTVNAFIGQLVKKSGRTTGLTRSSISALNTTVSITYDNECAGGTAFTKTFTGQLTAKNKASKFLNSGDSGSLMVEDITTNPRAIGLLFAGGSQTAIANPIGQVLTYFGATMVGQ